VAAGSAAVADIVPTPQAFQLYKVFGFAARAPVDWEFGWILDIRPRFRGGKAHFQSANYVCGVHSSDCEAASGTMSALDTIDILRVGGIDISTTPRARFE
jgi:hypothetical protein